jgi:branched-chain amino acid transport system permease protein
LNIQRCIRIIFLYYLILVLALITNYFTLRIRKFPVGRAWEALREDEIACKSLGVNPTNTKLLPLLLAQCLEVLPDHSLQQDKLS